MFLVCFSAVFNQAAKVVNLNLAFYFFNHLKISLKGIDTKEKHGILPLK